MNKQDLYDYIGLTIVYLRDSWRTKIVALILFAVLLTMSLVTRDGTGFIFVLPIIIILLLVPDDIFKKTES